MGIPKPEDGTSLRHWKARRAIRNLVWLVGALVLVYLVANNLQQSRANARLLKEKVQLRSDQVADLSTLLALVERAEAAALAAGQKPAVTSEAAVEALKKSGFPQEVIDAAVQQAKAQATTTTTSTTATTARAPTTTTTARQGVPGPPGPPGPAGPPGADSGGAGSTTTTSTTTTTTRPCTVGLLGLCVRL